MLFSVFPVFIRRHLFIFFKDPGKIAGIVIAHLESDFIAPQIRLLQQLLSPFHPQLCQIVPYADPHLTLEKVAEIVSGIADGCVQSGCALIGGETAEMPGFYPVDEYDVAGFAVGVVDKEKILKPETQKAGDILIAIKSSGVHSNGFSLIRKVFTVNEQTLARHFSDLGTTLGDSLLTPTKIYVKPILSLLEQVNVKAISHITGGGFYENIPRSLPEGISAQICRNNVQILPIFDLIARTGHIPERDMFNTFNMGVGMTVSVDKNDADKAVEILNNSGVEAYILGELVNSDEGVIIN